MCAFHICTAATCVGATGPVFGTDVVPVTLAAWIVHSVLCHTYLECCCCAWHTVVCSCLHGLSFFIIINCCSSTSRPTIISTGWCCSTTWQ